MNRKLLSLVIFSVLYISFLWGQTYVSGDVSGVWDSLGSPYVVLDNINVPEDSVLTILPGTNVLFQGGIYGTPIFWVFGKLIAIGDIEHYITFTSADLDSYGMWGGIRICNDDTTLFEYCKIDYIGDASDSGGGRAIFLNGISMAYC